VKLPPVRQVTQRGPAPLAAHVFEVRSLTAVLTLEHPHVRPCPVDAILYQFFGNETYSAKLLSTTVATGRLPCIARRKSAVTGCWSPLLALGSGWSQGCSSSNGMSLGRLVERTPVRLAQLRTMAPAADQIGGRRSPRWVPPSTRFDHWRAWACRSLRSRRDIPDRWREGDHAG
jgi:hypothetical protein